MQRILPRQEVLALALFVVLGGCGGDTPTEPTPPPGSCVYSATPAQVTPCMSSFNEMAATVLTTQGCVWTAGATAPWITMTPGPPGSGPGIVRFSVSENWDAPREGFVTVRGALPGQAADVRVTQAGCRYWVSREAVDLSASGGVAAFDVLQQSDPYTCGGPLQNACRWTAVSDSAWVTVTTPMPRTGDDRVAFTVAPNGTASARTGSITVRDKVVRITQAGL